MAFSSFKWYAIAPVIALCAMANSAMAQRGADRPLPEIEGIELFQFQSDLLTEFWGRPMFIEAGVVLPPDHDVDSGSSPVCYSIHGFGGSHRSAWTRGKQIRDQMSAGDYPRMIYVFLNAQFSLGHHEFADSVNNGPWGQALTEEMIPALEEKYGAVGEPRGRFLTGHSSGGWSSLWLMVTYPEFFAATFSTAPDSVDFRDFTGINVYDYDNAYVDPEGEDIQLVRRNGEWAMSIKGYVEREASRKSYGGQFQSFDAVFSPRGEDGRPQEMFDRETGEIDREVANAWKKYDIAMILRDNWETLGPKLKGKIRIYIGTQDTFRLEGAVKLLKHDLEALDSDAEILMVEGRDHGSLFNSHPEYWPNGMLSYIHHRMWEHWSK